jgi:hypothetical protein
VALLEIEELFKNLNDYKDFEVDGNIDKFNHYLAEIASLGHPLSVKHLLQYLDDTSKYPKVIFNIIRVLEKFQDDIYIRGLVPVIPSLMQRAPEWTQILHQRILNDPNAVDVYKQRLWNIKNDFRISIKQFLLLFKNSNPEFNRQCDELLYTIKKKELKSYRLPLDAEHFKQRLERACIDSFLATNTSHLDEKLCGLGLYCDASSLAIVPSVNTQAYLSSYQKSEREAVKWCPELWVYAGENDRFFNNLSEQLANELNGISSEEERDYFTLSIYGLCIDVLEGMRTRGFFKPDSIVAFAELGSQRGAYDIEWLERLNPQGIKPFIQWIDHLSDNEESNTSLQAADMIAT